MQNINIEIHSDDKVDSPVLDDSTILPQFFILDKAHMETDTSKYYMTEDEVREIITRYNTDLSKKVNFRKYRHYPLGKRKK